MKPLHHGIIDYAWAGAMIAAPFVFGFRKNTPAAVSAVSSGAAILGLNLVTDYEPGAARLLSYRTHTVAQAIASAGVMAAPWIFRFSGNRIATLAHLAAGIGSLAATVAADARKEARWPVPEHMKVPGQRDMQYQAAPAGAGLAKDYTKTGEEPGKVNLGPPPNLPPVNS